ncbi:hypothetical protein [Phytomonospora endophytica]|uniref:Putative phage protein gp47/JayE n=1 Tax=Phytomonospora endophytica TaxID=714109 RepID=A0A841F9N9_9ACTN|nr:hypothetical protein [Phytomonospora endophytica]MBB6033921.1 putative phage protein gp47/JayE [Phytomonospora endophytica]GIG64557.1 hypothetical protein Pen01_08520 [Phytomonospora endophytica]
MSYVPRAYPDIVRDLLTTLTGGVVREQITVPAGDEPVLVLQQLAQRPVRRVSHLTGRITAGKGANAREIDYRFTPADFELVGGEGGEPDAIAFRPGGRRPVPLSTVVVNYYPLVASPAPLTDLNVGSVTRTLLESVARELAEQYEHLRLVYESAFVDSATGTSLDQVVALVGAQRLPAGFPVVTLRFTRAAGVLGQVTVPAGTAVVDAAGNRYLTTAALTLEPGEPERSVQARGETQATPVVAAGALDRPAVLIAGVGQVTNPEPARGLIAPESDPDLRRRAKAALHGVVRGTTDALLFAVRSVPGVKDATLTEAPGEVTLTVVYEQDTAEVRRQVQLAIDDTRAAGIRVHNGAAEPLTVGARMRLTVAGKTAPVGSELAELSTGAVDRITTLLRGIAPGGKIRRAQLAGQALADPRVVDAEITLLPEGGAETDELQLPEGVTVKAGNVEVTGVEAEEATAGSATSAVADVFLPLHLNAGVTAAEAETAITAAVDAHLAGRAPDQPLTVDGLLAAARDDTRYAVVRTEVTVTVTDADRFLQLTDGQGSFAPQTGQATARGTVTLDVREGA